MLLCVQAGLLDKLRARAESRQLSDLTIGPVLTWTTEAILGHMNKLLQVPGQGGWAGGWGSGPSAGMSIVSASEFCGLQVGPDKALVTLSACFHACVKPLQP